MKDADILKWVNKKRSRGTYNGRSELEDELLGQILWAKLPMPEREYSFCPGRRFKADFAYSNQRLLVEVEGGLWIEGGGRHNRGNGYERDCEKYNIATLLGWRLLRVAGRHIKSGQALSWIEEALKK